MADGRETSPTKVLTYVKVDESLNFKPLWIIIMNGEKKISMC